MTSAYPVCTGLNLRFPIAMKRLLCIACTTILLTFQHSEANTIIIQAREAIIDKANVIVDAYVTDVAFTPIPRSSLGYAIVTLSIIEQIKGSAPSTIERWTPFFGQVVKVISGACSCGLSRGLG
jgi:hypothetical protein